MATINSSINYQQLLEDIKQQVTKYFKLRNNEDLLYHNRTHTENVVNAAIQLANHYQLNDHDFFVVTAAAWFHDVGYMEDKNNHEEHSARQAEDFLKAHYVDDSTIGEVKGCIMATKMPQKPEGLLQSIICDADVFHLGTATFNDNNKQMRKECKLAFNYDYSKQEWREKTIRFMEMHHYHTDYAKLLLDDQKAKNLQELKAKVEAWDQKNKPQVPVTKVTETTTVTETEHSQLFFTPSESAKPTEVYTEKNVKKKDKPEKGIETMFRVSSSNHQRLSDMADNKAHIMITVNSIILSAIISLLLRRLEDYSYLIIPTFIILMVSLTTMIFAILATRPSIPEGRFTAQDVDEKKVNLLFFGNFYRMNLQEYIAGMRNVMADREFLYGSLIIDVYSQGVVLGRKYRLLRISYNIFMFGLIASVLAFIIASAINGNGKH
ncbi:Pycsar system effector family protein [Mucilaginibacter aquatilis]|uniref:Pycsar system effector family protein n=1 Tax=Mucilaginibacter aquatilis TaxID=1517760 RepID=UPI0012FCCECF|nr:Pycsar system effector family protein [Mucilaginibacter aquatilis]